MLPAAIRAKNGALGGLDHHVQHLAGLEARRGGAEVGRLGEHRVAVVEALAAVGGGDEKLLGVKGDHLLRAQSANVSLVGAPTLPAWRRYTGVVWDHLQPESLTPEQRRRLIVPSGLLGLVRGDDPVPLDDHGAVVQGAARMEDALQEVPAHLGVDVGRVLGPGVERGLPLEGDQRAVAPRGHRRRRRPARHRCT